MPHHQLGTKPPKRTDHQWQPDKYKVLTSRPNNISSPHWAIQKANNEYKIYAHKELPSHNVVKSTAIGYPNPEKNNVNQYHGRAFEGFKYWYKDQREVMGTKSKWFGQTRPMGMKGSFTGLPQF